MGDRTGGRRNTGLGPFYCSHFVKLAIISVMVILTCGRTVDADRPRPIPDLSTVELKTAIQRIAVHRDTGEVFVGARNIVYRLTDELREVEQITTGPVNDNPECRPAPETCPGGRRPMDNDNQMLVINYDNQPVNVLACGTAQQGMCRMVKATDITRGKLFGSPKSTINYLASRRNTVAFYAPSEITGGAKVLFVASEYDGRPELFAPPTLSAKMYSTQPVGFRFVSQTNTSVTKISLHPRYQATYDIRYVYGFHDGSYAYFLTTQPVSPSSSFHETRLGRVCLNDPTFFSYTEIPLQCEPGGEVFDLADAGYLSRISRTKYAALDVDEDSDQALFVTFTSALQGGQGRAVNRTKGSVLCAFAMKTIDGKFRDSVTQCLKASARTKLLEPYLGEPRACTRMMAANDNSVEPYLCGTGLNPYIEGSEPLLGVPIFHMDKEYATSLAVTMQEGETVAAIGTEGGKLMKVLVDGTVLSSMNFAGNTGSDTGVLGGMTFDPREKYLYFATGNQLIKYPIGSCSIYTDCASCYSTRDPLKCVWCGTRCSGISECNQNAAMTGKCPPELFDFSPKRGPTAGGTEISISGVNFGSPQATFENKFVNVTVGGVTCDVTLWKENALKCRTRPASEEKSGTVEVYAYDVSVSHIAFDVDGRAVSEEAFQYMVPSVTGITPSFGPFAGGTNVTLFGSNLDIGQKRMILLKDVECVERSNAGHRITCTSGAYNETRNATTGDVVLHIDDVAVQPTGASNYSDQFEYRPNPTIYEMTPKGTVASGGTYVTVSGTNLDSVSWPRMRVTATSSVTLEQIRMVTNCSVKDSGTTMTCRTPELPRDSIPPPTMDATISTQVTFLMDGVEELSNLPPEDYRLVYYPNPEFRGFLGDALEVIYYDDHLLDIYGTDLCSSYDVNVTVGSRYSCTVQPATSWKQLTCYVEFGDDDRPDSEKKYDARVTVGKVALMLGNVTFRQRPEPPAPRGPTVASIVLPLVIAMVIAVVIVVLALYLKARGVIFKKEKDSHSVIFIPSENGGVENDYEGRRPQVPRRGSQNDYPGCDETREPFISPGYHVDDEKMAILTGENLLLDRDRLTLGEVIGQGQFGCVYKGTLFLPGKEDTYDVAVKTLHSNYMSDEQDCDTFMKEALMMRDFHHEHVLTLIGVCFDTNRAPMVVIPFMAHGDLLSYIRDERNSPTVKSLIEYGIQIAHGMQYLASLKFVHRDLAARNCVLDDQHNVKVADFGLSRDVYERDYYSSDNKKTKLPVKWMAPESLIKGTYNTKTDVWSYGVVLWELITRGATPYSEVDNWDIIKFLQIGRRLPQPELCPDLLFAVMESCWAADSKHRPTFDQLAVQVEGVITKLEAHRRQRKVGLEVNYINYPVAPYYNDRLTFNPDDIENTPADDESDSAPAKPKPAYVPRPDAVHETGL